MQCTMNNILISIIVPVYNSEKYLHKCVNSIQQQTYKNWELILIDDGSNDSSPRICDWYSLQDKRILVIHKANEGVSVARNIGLTKSKGDYITFADSDDYLEPYTFQTYIDEIVKNTSDIIKVGYFKDFESGNQKIISINQDYVFDKTWDFHRTLEHSFYYSFIWNMCIKHECIKNIKFDEDLNWCEDHIFSYQCYFNCKKMSILSKPCYHYQIHRTGSLSSIKNPIIVKKASEKERLLKTKLNAGIYTDVQKETEDEYRYRLHTIVQLLYTYNNTFNDRFFFSKECLMLDHLKYKEEKIFFQEKIPFFIRDSILKLFYYLKKKHLRRAVSRNKIS